MHKRRRRSPSAKSTTHQSVEKQHALPDSIAKANREHRRGNKSSQMVKAHMQAPKAKKSASNFIPIGVALFIKGRSSACSVSGSRRLPLIVQLALRRPHFHPSFARPKIISGYKFL